MTRIMKIAITALVCIPTALGVEGRKISNNTHPAAARLLNNRPQLTQRGGKVCVESNNPRNKRMIPTYEPDCGRK